MHQETASGIKTSLDYICKCLLVVLFQSSYTQKKGGQYRRRSPHQRTTISSVKTQPPNWPEWAWTRM